MRRLLLKLAVGALLAGGPAAAESPVPAHNPALNDNFPDPSLLETRQGQWFAYSTNDRVNVPVAQFVHGRWLQLQDGEKPRDAMPLVPLWIAGPDRPKREHRFGDDIWAPEVMWIAGRYVLYFNGRHHSERTPLDRERNGWERRQCIGTATSKDPDRGFVAADEPLICLEYQEGVIDAHVFQDGDGKLYLYYKNDANCCLNPDGSQEHTKLYVRELDASGLRLASPSVDVGVQNDQPWEGYIVEAPTMVEHDGRYYLFYSGNWFFDDRYGIGYARCEGPKGKCTDVTTERALIGTCDQSTPARFGPGHQDIIKSSNGRYYIALHARASRAASNAPRLLHVYELEWKGGDPQPIPPCR